MKDNSDTIKKLNELKAAAMRAEVDHGIAIKALLDAFGVSAVADAKALLDQLKEEHLDLIRRREAIEEELANVKWDEI